MHVFKSKLICAVIYAYPYPFYYITVRCHIFWNFIYQKKFRIFKRIPIFILIFENIHTHKFSDSKFFNVDIGNIIPIPPLCWTSLFLEDEMWCIQSRYRDVTKSLGTWYQKQKQKVGSNKDTKQALNHLRKLQNKPLTSKMIVQEKRFACKFVIIS